MVPTGVACLDCTIQCERLHGGKDGGFLPIVDRFFKIMFGKDRSKFLSLPPASAKIVKHLTDQETLIEDSSGQQWSVTLSLVNGFLAFENGWQKFFLDHGLKEGELLVFEYTGGSHFTVQIYGTSARERTNFNNVMPRPKRRRRCQGTASEDAAYDVNSRDISILPSGDELRNFKTKPAVENAGFEGSELHPISVDIEDPICMITNRSVGYHEEHRSLYDLSFEMENRTSDANKCEEAAFTMLDSHTETEQSDVNLDNASNTKISLSSNQVLESTNPAGNDAMEQTKSASEDSQMVVIETDLITSNTGDTSVDKFEAALDAKTSLSPTEIADKVGILYSASDCNFQDGKEPSVMLYHTQMNFPLVEKFSLSCNQVLEPTNPAGDEAMEQAKTAAEDVQMVVIDSDPVTCNTGDISIDKLETALDAKTALSHTEITDQIREKVDDIQMASHSCQAGGHSDDAFMDMIYEKPSYNRKMKAMLDHVFNAQHGKAEPFGLSPSIGGSKIAEKEHEAKSKFGEFSVSSSTVKNPLGLHAMKKEVKMENTFNVFDQVSSCGRDPSLVWNQPQMISPPVVVKTEPDEPCEIGQWDTINPVLISPFSAEVKSKLYLEVPLHIKSQGRRLRAQIIRAQSMRPQMIVYLRDSARRLWPVVYREYGGGGVFIGNWSAFCNHNNIKPGDKCRFEAEGHVASFVFRVDVAR